MKTLILGTAVGYGVAEVRPFVESLRRHHDGEVQLLVSGRAAPELLAYFAEKRITPRFFEAAEWIPVHVQTTRYFRYREILRESATRYERILLADVADVFFQADPFAGASAGEIVFFLEDARMTIGRCETNSMWLCEVLGEPALAQVAACRISCSGTTMGSHAALLHYLEQLLALLPPALTPAFQEHRGHDQALHNWLLHTGAFPQARTSENGEWIFTLGQVPPGEIVASTTGLRTNEGRRCPVIHQWTYHAHTAAWVAQQNLGASSPRPDSP